MANPEHLALLKSKRGVKAWNEWRQAWSEIRPDLSDADLFGADLRGADLHGADLIEADLRKADLGGADLGGARLYDADLSKADLSKADLREAALPLVSLRGADLREAILSEADLRWASLNKANLTAANLIEVDLREAVLIEANLRWADLRRADLRDVDLRGAHLGHAALHGALSGLDLSGVEGLAEVRHFGPSSVGTDTLELTAAGLTENPSRRGEVEAFLRGAGVSERYMETFGYSIGRAIEFYSCFISYSAEDEGFASRLYDGLQGRSIRCWLDEHQLLPGDDIYEQIDRGIRLWDKVLLCCSEASLTSWWVEKEIKKAFKKEQEIRKREKRKVRALIPLCLDPTLFRWEDELASIILERHAADFTGWKTDSAKFDEQFERVVKALRTDEAKRERPPEPKL